MKTPWICFFLALILPYFDATAGWESVNGYSEYSVTALAVCGRNVFAGTDSKGVLLSSDSGATWTPVNAGLTNLHVTSLAAMGTTVFAGTDGGVYRTTNDGGNWIAVNSGLTCRKVLSLVSSGTKIFAGMSNDGRDSQGGIFLSTDSGETWSTANTGLPPYLATDGSFFGFITVRCLASSPEGTTNPCLLAGTASRGVFLSTNDGISWTALEAGLTDRDISSVAISNTSFFVATPGDGVFQSSDGGAHWSICSGRSRGSPYSLACQGSDLLVGRWFGIDIFYENGTVDRLYLDGPPVYAVAWNGPCIFGGNGDGIWRSTDNGQTWSTPLSVRLPINLSWLADGGKDIFAATYDGIIYRSSDDGGHWTYAGPGFPDQVSLSGMVASGSVVLVGTTSLGLYRSSNSGRSWSQVDGGIPASGSVTVCAAKPDGAEKTTLLASCDVGTFRSTDWGLSWVVLSPGLSYPITSIVFHNSILFAGTRRNSVFQSMDNGSHWTEASTGLHGARVNALASCGSNLLAALDYGKVFLSTNSGTSWTDSTAGLNWTNVRALSVQGKNVFAATELYGVLLSTDRGWSWTPVNTYLPSSYSVYALAMHGAYLYAISADYNSVWRRPLAEMITVGRPNLVQNPGFEEGSGSWQFFTSGTGSFSDSATGAGSPHAARIVISSPAENVQLYQSGIPLKAHTRYVLKFKASSTTNTPLSIFLHQHDTPYTDYGINGWRYYPGTTWTSVVREFATENIAESVNDARLRFSFGPYGKAGDQYFIDDVELIELEPYLIANGNFEWDTSNWEFYTNGAATFDTGAEADSGNHVARIKIQAPGSNVQLYQPGVTLVEGARYRISFRSFSKTGHSLSLYMHKHSPPFSGYGLEWVNIPLTPSWQTFTREFTASGFTGTVSDGRLRFWLAPFATASDEYLFDDVMLERIDVGSGSALVASVKETETDVPKEFALFQNYPNPFNPRTVVSSQLPVVCNVKLIIYDLLGREVAVLVNERRTAGKYQDTFDASMLSSGIYICRMTAGEFTQAMKMLLVK